MLLSRNSKIASWPFRVFSAMFLYECIFVSPNAAFIFSLAILAVFGWWAELLLVSAVADIYYSTSLSLFHNFRAMYLGMALLGVLLYRFTKKRIRYDD